MSKKWLVFILLVVVISIGIFLIFGGDNRKSPLLKKPEPVPQAQVLSIPSIPPSYQIPSPNLPPVPPGVKVPPEVARNPTALSFFLASMTPISFYGKVVDDKDGTPIEGATAEIGAIDKVVENGSTYYKTTDANGLFSITGIHGFGVGIHVSKKGYYEVNQSLGEYDYAPGLYNQKSNPTRESPAIFMLRKKGTGVQLVIKGFNGHLPKDGTPVDVDLEAGKVVAPGTGNFRMELWSNYNPAEPNNPYDWKYQISVPGGGLIVRTDDLDFEAPSDDYQATDEASYSYTSDPSDYRRDLNKQYFVQLADGKYARITLSMSRGFNILAYINPTPGNRNLEPASK